MELYIRIKNGQPFEHPILGNNFRQAFPDVNTNNLPEWVAKFERVLPPVIGPYEIYEGVTYQWVGDFVKDVHIVRQMTLEEKQEKQNNVKTNWAENGFASWLFDENLCIFVPPIPYPTDGKRYFWDEATITWLEVANVD